MVDNKNSQFGTMWITDGEKNSKIKKEENIPEGWRRGRVSVHPDGYKKHLVNKQVSYNSDKRKTTILERYGSFYTDRMKRGFQLFCDKRKDELKQKSFDEKSTKYKIIQILEEQQNKCLSCGLSEWLGNKIKFELDHIDGNTKNNNRENLRILCPNCHSFTPTWRKKKQ